METVIKSYGSGYGYGSGSGYGYGSIIVEK